MPVSYKLLREANTTLSRRDRENGADPMNERFSAILFTVGICAALVILFALIALVYANGGPR